MKPTPRETSDCTSHYWNVVGRVWASFIGERVVGGGVVGVGGGRSPGRFARRDSQVTSDNKKLVPNRAIFTIWVENVDNNNRRVDHINRKKYYGQYRIWFWFSCFDNNKWLITLTGDNNKRHPLYIHLGSQNFPVSVFHDPESMLPTLP